MLAGLSRLVVLAVIGAMLVTTPLSARESQPHPIEQHLATIRTAALQGDVELVQDIFAHDLLLVSQSGKVYGRDAALFDLANGFDTWRNEDVTIRADDGTAVASFINNRTRTGLELGEVAFRVTQFWRMRAGAWKLIAQSSVRLKD